MSHRLRWLSLLVLCLLPGLLRAEDGKLAAVRKEVRGESSKPKEEHDNSDGGCCDAEDDDEGAASLWIAAYVGEVAESWRTPFYFPRYPFADGYAGYLRHAGQERPRGPFDLTASGEEAKVEPDALLNTRSWSCRVSFEEGNDFAGLNRLGGQVFIDTTCRLGALVNCHYFAENLHGCSCADLLFGDANLTVGLLRTPAGADRIGVGLKFMTDVIGTEYGVNFHYGADLFPFKPLILSWSVDGGTLGDAYVTHFRGSLGFGHSHGELFLGYDSLRIGSVVLDGPYVGLRLWF